jgi:hypothetical protein
MAGGREGGGGAPRASIVLASGVLGGRGSDVVQLASRSFPLAD